MRKCLISFFSFLYAVSAFGAGGEDCRNELVSQLQKTLTSSYIDVESPTLESDVRALLEPKFIDIIENNSKCQDAENDLFAYNKTGFVVGKDGHEFDIVFRFLSANDPIELPEEIMESVLPWYGILVVKKGSLDKYANADVPIVSTEYMKDHKSEFYPDNSNRALGLRRACTHGNHTANDNDVVNRAAHITMGEKDSFWSGNDYYVYDGEDVYWGWATAVGEVALAIVSFGLSAELEGGVAAANVAVQGASKAVTASKLTKNTAKITKAADLAKKAKSGSSAAAVASRADATKALAEAGVTVKKGTTAKQLNNIGAALKTAAGGIKDVKWTSALAKPWKLTQRGVESIKPKNIAKLYGPGVTWGQRIKRGAFTAAGAGLGYEIIKAFGYSSASYKLDDKLKFNSFGLLSADDLEGHENDVSHGSWLKFEEGGAVNEDDPLNEALRFAEEFQEDMDQINKDDPQCNVDIYVVQPAISDPQKMGKREVYYIIQNPGASLRVQTKK